MCVAYMHTDGNSATNLSCCECQCFTFIRPFVRSLIHFFIGTIYGMKGSNTPLVHSIFVKWMYMFPFHNLDFPFNGHWENFLKQMTSSSCATYYIPAYHYFQGFTPFNLCRNPYSHECVCVCLHLHLAFFWVWVEKVCNRIQQYTNFVLWCCRFQLVLLVVFIICVYEK